MERQRGKRNGILIGILCAGVIGIVFFAVVITLKLLDRRQDKAYYDSLADMYFTDPVSKGLQSADIVIK